MYAIVSIAGKQFKVEQNKKVKVPLLPGAAGDTVKFDSVLLYVDDKEAVHIGTPNVSKVSVSATVVEHGRDKKVIVFKKKRRKGYQKKNGHRQDFTMLHIDAIGAVKAARAKKEAVSETSSEMEA
jgi:large subunit ribosomal protein L21